MVKDPMEEMQNQVQNAQLHEDEQNTLTPEDEFGVAFDEDEEQHGQHDEPKDQPTEQVPAMQDEGVPGSQVTEGDHADSGDGHGDQRYNSMMGRLKAAQKENSDLKSQLFDMKAMIEAMRSPAPQKQDELVPVEGLDDLPEEIRPLAQEKSREGDAVRKMLEEYGPEHASVMAQSVLARREAANATARMQQQYEVDNDKRHRQALADAHPEFADAILGNAEKWRELENGLNAWIHILPYGEAAELVRIKQSGTTQEVSMLLAKYKQFRSGTKPTARPAQPQSSAASRIARSNVAVPSVGKAVPPKEKANDFDSAWDEAPD